MLKENSFFTHYRESPFSVSTCGKDCTVDEASVIAWCKDTSPFLSLFERESQKVKQREVRVNGVFQAVCLDPRLYASSQADNRRCFVLYLFSEIRLLLFFFHLYTQ